MLYSTSAIECIQYVVPSVEARSSELESRQII